MVASENGEPDKEKLAMRKRIMELEMENEILKKAAIIFSRDG
jgi:transposase-like protein